MRYTTGCSERADLAAVEERAGVAEDEIHVAFDVAVREILAAAVGVEGVLVAEEADVAEDGAVAGDLDCDGLRTFGKRTVARVAVFKGEVLGIEIVAGDGGGGGERGAAGGAVGVVVGDDDVLGIGAESAQLDARCLRY